MRRAIQQVVWLAAAQGAALGPSVNVDMNRGPGAGAGASVPTHPFGAASGQNGVWNDVPRSGNGPFALLGVDGLPSGVTLSRTGSSVDGAFGHSFTTGDYDRLLDDYQMFNGPSSIVLSGLRPGAYTLYCYGITPFEDLNYTEFDVSGATNTNPQFSGGAMPVNNFALGTTHAKHDVVVDAGGTIVITLGFFGKSDVGVVNGLQLVELNPPRLFARTGATGMNNGLSWINAFTSLDAALLAAATPGSACQEVWVTQGTHRPQTPATPGLARSATFKLRDGLTLRGGFFGNELLPQDRDPAVFQTILNGNLGNQGSSSDNAYHVVTMDQPGAAKVEQITIREGTASGPGEGALGGGVFVSAGMLTVERCSLLANSAVGGGAAAASVGGILVLSNSRIFDNSGTDPIRIGSSGEGRIVNTTVAANVGGIVSDGQLVVHNSIIWGNDGASITAASGSHDVRHSCIQGGFPGTANTSGDPRFVNLGLRNFNLGEGSPAVDSGSNALVLPGVTTDWAGQPRFYDDTGRPDLGVGPAPVVDMGAIERQLNSPPPPPCGGDANNDLRVDGADLSVLLFQFGQAVQPGSGADFNDDGQVDGADLSVLLSRFGLSC